MSAAAEQYLGAAEQLGRRLVETAVWHEDRCIWLGDDLEPAGSGWEVVHRSSGPDLYAGTSGIALFLGSLASVCGDDSFRRTAEGGLRHALRTGGHHEHGGPSGLYVGTSGVAWAAAQLGELLVSEELADAGATLAEELAVALVGAPDGHGSDLVAGGSGTLTALLALAAAPERAGLMEICRELGDRLLGEAHRSAFGWCWAAPGDDGRGDGGLCGLAHGASGVARALLELYAATGSAEYRFAAQEAVRYERGWFDRRHCNWPDLRDPSGDGRTEHPPEAPFSFPVHWCHGAVGIGLARLRAYQVTGEPAALAEAGAAIQAARVAAGRSLSAPPAFPIPFEANLSVCHGLAGIAELFLFAYEVTGHQEHLRAARRIGDRGVALAAAQGDWPCGVPAGGEAPGLMLGLAGIGALYLRLFDPRSMPPLGLLAGWPPAASARGRPRWAGVMGRHPPNGD